MDMSLPELAASRNLEDGQPVIIKRGESGFYPQSASFDPNVFNAQHGVTPAQREAMVLGSAFGWDVPGAYAARWEGVKTVPVTI